MSVYGLSAKWRAASHTTSIMLSRRVSAAGELPLQVDRLLGKPPDIEELRRAITDLTAEPAI